MIPSGIICNYESSLELLIDLLHGGIKLGKAMAGGPTFVHSIKLTGA